MIDRYIPEAQKCILSARSWGGIFSARITRVPSNPCRKSVSLMTLNTPQRRWQFMIVAKTELPIY